MKDLIADRVEKVRDLLPAVRKYVSEIETAAEKADAQSVEGTTAVVVSPPDTLLELDSVVRLWYVSAVY